MQAVTREVLEETGFFADIVTPTQPLPFANIQQLPIPLAIIVADVAEGPHQHIDMSYALRPRAAVPRIAPEADHGFIWVTRDQLLENEPVTLAPGSVEFAPSDDVRVLALVAIDLIAASM